jgi:hypothetical protein
MGSRKRHLAAVTRIVLSGVLSACTPGGEALAQAPSACPIRVHILLDKPTFSPWEMASGQVLVTNQEPRPVPSTVVVTLSHGARQFSRREIALDIPAGRQAYDLATALGFWPLIPPNESFRGEWRLSVEARTRECIGSGAATFSVRQEMARLPAAWDGLVGYWPFDDERGSMALDWSGAGGHAEVSGGAWVAGGALRALAFDGRSTGVKLPRVQAPGPQGMTVAFRIWPEDGGTDPHVILARPAGSGGPSPAGWAIVLDRDKPFLQVREAGRAPRLLGLLPGPDPLPSRTWSHVALTQSGQRLTLYVNGRSVGSSTGRLPGGSGGDMFLGRGEPGETTPGFRGRLAGLRIFARALSPEEVRAEPGVAMPAVVSMLVDPSIQVGEIGPLIYGVNVEGGDPFELPPGFGISSVRWPGGCFAEGYHWRSAVGSAREQRARGAAVCEGEQMSSPSVRADVGPDEFMAILRRGGAVPVLTVNFATGTAQEAANWVEYMNGESPGLSEGSRWGWTPDSYGGNAKAPPGYFAWLREYFGNRQPYGVKYWAVGNEFEARSTPSWTRDATQYYWGGEGRITSLMSRDPTRTDWSLEQRTSAGEPSAEFFTPFVPVVPGSEKVEVLPILRKTPLELGPATVWDPVPRITAAGPRNVYQIRPEEGRIVFGDGIRGNLLPSGSVVRITYTSGPHDGFVEYARRMKAVDPTILVGTSAAFSEIPAEAAAAVDFGAVNLYPSHLWNDPDPVKRYYRILASPVSEFEPYLRRAHEYLRRGFPARKIQLAVTEYNFSLDSPHLRSLASALFVADALRVFATHQVSLANYYSLDLLRARDARGRGEPPPGIVFRLYRDHFGTKLIATRTMGIPDSEGDLDGRNVRFPFLEVLASAKEGGRTVSVMILNKHAEHPFALAVQVAGEPGPLGGRILHLWGEHPFAEEVVLTTREVRGTAGTLRVTVPPHSVNVLEIGRGD